MSTGTTLDELLATANALVGDRTNDEILAELRETERVADACETAEMLLRLALKVRGVTA